jgi:hypothetical protein
MGDGDHLHLLELVLAQHACGVAARAAGLGPEAQGMGGIPAGQVILLHDMARDDVGQRHLGGGDQPPAIGGLVAVLAEFRQLAGAIHYLGAHEDGAVDLGQAVFLVWVSSMNCASARWSRATAPDISTKREPESFAAVSKSMPGRDAGQLEMLLRLEVELPRGAPAVDLDVVVLVRAVGDVVIGQVRDAGEQVAQFGVLFLGFLLQRGDLVLLGGHQRAQALEFRLVALALARPTSFEAALRSASAASAAWMQARRASSSDRISDDCGARPLRARAASKAFRGLADGADVVHGGCLLLVGCGAAYGEVCGSVEGAASRP